MSICLESPAASSDARDCGAACLSIIYKSFGKVIPQEQIWPSIAKKNRFGVLSSTTHLMAKHAAAQELNALVLQVRHPIHALRLCCDNGIGAILNHRPHLEASNGHYTILVTVSDKDVILLDPAAGPSRVSHDELIRLWQPASRQSEIAGNVLIAVASQSSSKVACEFCHTAIPEAMACPRCGIPVRLSPAAVLGCVRDGCIARMWDHIACPDCDFVFNESGTVPLQTDKEPQTKSILSPPDLNPAFAQLDRFLSLVLSLPGMMEHADIKAQAAFIEQAKQEAMSGQASEIAAMNAKLATLAGAQQQKQKQREDMKKKAEKEKTPLPLLDPDELGASLLRNLGLT